MLKRQPIAVAAIAAITVAMSTVLTGCGRSNGATPSVPAEPTSTTSSPYGEIATIPPDQVSAVAVVETPVESVRGLDTLEAASQNLWDSWRDDDRERAQLYASVKAVDMLFATPWGPEARNQGCGYSNNVARCVYTLRDPERREIVARVVVIDRTDAGFRVDRVVAVGAVPKADRLDGGLVDDAVVLTDETLPADVANDLDTTQGPLEATFGTDEGLNPDSSLLDPALDPALAGTPAASETQGPTETPDAPAPIDGSGQTDETTVSSGGEPSGTKATKRRTSKRRTTKKATTKRKKKKTTSPASEDSPSPPPSPGPSPSPEPAPAPDPAPAPGPVQAGGETVNTVG